MPAVHVLSDPGGLDPRHSGGGFYGRGVYLSERPDYQIGGRYAHFVSGSGQRLAELVVVKAALGAQQDFGTRVDTDTRNMAMPGVRSEEPILQRFDSVRAGPHRPHVAGVGDSGLNASFVHVLYEKRQLYVAYAIEVQLGVDQPQPAVAAAPAAVPTAKPATALTAKPAPTAKRQKTTPDETLNIMLRDQTGEEAFFKVKKTTKLDKLFNAYSQRKGVNASSLRFLFDGQRVRGDQTAGGIGMEDGDRIDVMLDPMLGPARPPSP